MDRSVASSQPMRIREADMTGHLGVLGIMQRVQDISEDFISHIDCSCRTLMQRYGWSWMLAVLHCEMDSLPLTEDMLKTRIWPAKKSGAMLPWYYSFEDGAGRRFGSASGCWMVADLEERKMIRPRDLPFTIEEDTVNGTPCPLPPILMPLKKYEVRGEHTVGYNDCDINGHMNNISYARIALEHLSEKRCKQCISSFDMFFAKEAKLFEKLTVCFLESKEEDRIALKNELDEQIFLSCFKWRDVK